VAISSNTRRIGHGPIYIQCDPDRAPREHGHQQGSLTYCTHIEEFAEFLAFNFNSESALAPKLEGIKLTFMKRQS